MPDPITEVIGFACFAVCATLAVLQYRRLRTAFIHVVTIRRHQGDVSVSVASRVRASRLRQVATAPSGIFVRTALASAATGLLLAARAWPVVTVAVVVVQAALVAWQPTLWITAWARRARHARASSAS
jgi:predicted pyridoxine 5'-phosphate oxidase superfamily flavin-nucleotide-binding protein